MMKRSARTLAPSFVLLATFSMTVLTGGPLWAASPLCSQAFDPWRVISDREFASRPADVFTHVPINPGLRYIHPERLSEVSAQLPEEAYRLDLQSRRGKGTFIGSDLHLGNRLNPAEAELLGKRGIELASTLARSGAIGKVLLLGDLTDASVRDPHDRNKSTGEFLRAFVRQIGPQIPIEVALGNHDLQRATSLKGRNGVTLALTRPGRITDLEQAIRLLGPDDPIVVRFRERPETVFYDFAFAEKLAQELESISPGQVRVIAKNLDEDAWTQLADGRVVQISHVPHLQGPRMREILGITFLADNGLGPMLPFLALEADVVFSADAHMLGWIQSQNLMNGKPIDFVLTGAMGSSLRQVGNPPSAILMGGETGQAHILDLSQPGPALPEFHPWERRPFHPSGRGISLAPSRDLQSAARQGDLAQRVRLAQGILGRPLTESQKHLLSEALRYSDHRDILSALAQPGGFSPEERGLLIRQGFFWR